MPFPLYTPTQVSKSMIDSPMTSWAMKGCYNNLKSSSFLGRQVVSRFYATAACATLAIESVGHAAAYGCERAFNGVPYPPKIGFKTCLFSMHGVIAVYQMAISARNRHQQRIKAHWQCGVRSLALAPSMLIQSVLDPKQAWKTCQRMEVMIDHRGLTRRFLDWNKGW